MRVYLDTQQWDYLTRPSDLTGPAVSRDRLIRAAQERDLTVVGSLDLLAEFAPFAATDPDLYADRMALFWQLVGGRVLRPLNERAPAEARTGGQLKPKERYLAPAAIRSLRSTFADPERTAAIASDVAAERDRFLTGELGVLEAMTAGLRAKGVEPSHQLTKQWFEQMDAEEWVWEVNRAGCARYGFDLRGGPGDGARRFPSTWVYNAYRLARVHAVLGEGRKPQPSDLFDGHHLACGPYVDAVVTSDKAMLHAFGLMTNWGVPVQVVSPHDLNGMLS